MCLVYFPLIFATSPGPFSSMVPVSNSTYTFKLYKSCKYFTFVFTAKLILRSLNKSFIVFRNFFDLLLDVFISHLFKKHKFDINIIIKKGIHIYSSFYLFVWLFSMSFRRKTAILQIINQLNYHEGLLHFK